jgi:pimeloyl-ACP methyl ester carboxylesterase
MNSKTFIIEYQGNQFKIAANYQPNGKKLILCIHGLGCTKESFSDIFEFPQFNDYSILIPDLVGFGESSKPDDFSYTMEEQAEIIKIILDEINPERVHIVAHSMGGAVGLLLAERISDMLATFTNIEGNLIGEDCAISSRKTISVDFEEFKARLFDEMKTEIAKSKEKGSKLWSKMIGQSDAFAFYKSSQSLVKWSDSGELLKKFISLKNKKTYVYGERNSSMKILSELGNIEKISISNSGHFVMNVNPRDFYDTLSQFIGRQIKYYKEADG